jgi:hypothetical protein
MRQQLLASPSVGRNQGADMRKTLPKKPLLALAGAAVLLLGCAEDPVGKAPGGLEPSASSQQSGDHDDAGGSDPGDGGQSGGSGEGSDGDDSGDGGSGGGSGGAN